MRLGDSTQNSTLFGGFWRVAEHKRLPISTHWTAPSTLYGFELAEVAAMLFLIRNMGGIHAIVAAGIGVNLARTLQRVAGLYGVPKHPSWWRIKY